MQVTILNLKFKAELLLIPDFSRNEQRSLTKIIRGANVPPSP